LALDVITTTAGRAAILGAVASSGTITVQDCQISETNQTVTPSTVALASVVATLTSVVGSVRSAGAGHALHVVVKDESAASYTVRAFALRLTGGTILMVYSQAGAIATKASDSTLLLAFDWTIDADTAATIDFGDTDFALPAASETVPGVVELATIAETQAGADAVRAVTPAALASLTSLDTRRGLIELADLPEVTAGVDAVRAISPLALKYRLDTLDSMASFLALNLFWTGGHRFADAEKIRYTADQQTWLEMPLPSCAVEGFPTPVFTWSPTALTGPTLNSVASSKRVWVPLRLPNGFSVDQLRVRLYPGTARATVANRMQVDVWERHQDTTGAPTKLNVTAATDNGAATAQTVTLSQAFSVDNALKSYWLTVTSGNTGAADSDLLASVFVRGNLRYPLKK
jgi:hypothetical protein